MQYKIIFFILTIYFMYNTQIEIKAHSNVQPASSPCQQAKAVFKNKNLYFQKLF